MKKYLNLLCTLPIVLSSCQEFVDVPPPKTQITTSMVFDTDPSALSAVMGIYSEIVKVGDFAGGGTSSVTVLTGLSSDELINYATSDALAFYNSAIQPVNATLKTSLWSKAYKIIYYSNAVLEGLDQSTGISAAMRSQLQGEALFIRAFCYFYLVNMFGEIPLVTATDYQANSMAGRSAQENIYQLMIQDLTNAYGLLLADYIGGERIRPNKSAAAALLARIYLYKGDYAKAGEQASLVISQSRYGIIDINNVFLKNSNETILQFRPVAPQVNSWEGSTFILTAAPTLVSLRREFQQSFETADRRRTSWIGSIIVSGTTYYYPFKYKVKSSATITEYSTVLRLAEQYLIRAEARAQLGDFAGARSDINVIRTRAGLANTTATDLNSLLLAIEQERKFELFAEWGHRWLDLKRYNRASTVLSPVKGANWQSTDVLYPIPQTEINNDPNLSQNPGY